MCVLTGYLFANKNSYVNKPQGGVKRNSNLELYRIVLMFLILGGHCAGCSGLTAAVGATGTWWERLFFDIIAPWGRAAIDGFVLITGYFMCTAQIKVKKFLRLLLEVIFYAIVIDAVFVLTGYASFSPCKLYLDLMPLSYVGDSFITAYLVFYLFIPFLNIAVHHMSHRQHALLIALGTALYVAIPLVPWGHVDRNLVSWFMVVYFIAAYIRRYGLLPRLSHRAWGWLALACVAAGVAAMHLTALLTSDIVPAIARTASGDPAALLAKWCDTQYANPRLLIGDVDRPIALAAAVCSFMWFKDLRLPQSRVINLIAASTFGVLLIHNASDIMRRWLWNDIWGLPNTPAGVSPVLYFLLVAIATYAACVVIDQVRIKLFNVVIRNWELRSKKSYGDV